ncbi:MAG: FMN-binding protein [Chloroflexi bacterium]|nr:MAG: FMN-binding protein [Chloroflexota bacterium]
MSEKKPIKLKMNKRDRTKRWERWLAIAAIVSIVVAWFAGASLKASDIMPAIKAAMPEADRLEKLDGDTFAAYAQNSPETLIGYVTLGEAVGYGGPIVVAVGVDLEGNVVETAVSDHVETPSFFKRVMDADFTEQLLGKTYHDAFQLDEDIDGITGATYTSRALAVATLAGSQKVARDQLNLEVASPPAPTIFFGIPEISVLALYAVGYFAHQRKFKYKKQARWVMLITGMVVLGFWFNLPLTISKINTFLLGYWPQWQTNLYWYFLLGGIFFVLTVDNKNAYCAWFCPFGAAQECMGAIGGAKISGPRKYRRFFVWLQRGLAWAAIMIALLFRNPGLSSFEVFGTLFSFTGSIIMFGLLGIILVMSLFVKRPWCNFLCPLDPVYDIIRLVRGWVMDSVKKVRKGTATS